MATAADDLAREGQRRPPRRRRTQARDTSVAAAALRQPSPDPPAAAEPARPARREATAPATAPACRPAARLSPAPPLEPPFDDELGQRGWHPPPELGAQLAFEWRAGGGALLSGSGSAPPHPPEATVRAGPDAWHAAARFLNRCIEIFNGYRPASHARPMTEPGLARQVAEELSTVARRTALGWRRNRPAGAGAASATGSCSARPAGTHFLAVGRRRLRVSEPLPGIVEATAVLCQADRAWAVAFRLEHRRGAWLCTAFLDLPPRTTGAVTGGGPPARVVPGRRGAPQVSNRRPGSG